MSDHSALKNGGLFPWFTSSQQPLGLSVISLCGLCGLYGCVYYVVGVVVVCVGGVHSLFGCVICVGAWFVWVCALRGQCGCGLCGGA